MIRVCGSGPGCCQLTRQMSSAGSHGAPGEPDAGVDSLGESPVSPRHEAKSLACSGKLTENQCQLFLTLSLLSPSPIKLFLFQTFITSHLLPASTLRIDRTIWGFNSSTDVPHAAHAQRPDSNVPGTVPGTVQGECQVLLMFQVSHVSCGNTN